MVLAREESTYIHQHMEEQQAPKTNKNRRPNKTYKLEKLMICGVLLVTLSCSILLLTRFMAITEARHRVNSLQKQIEKLEGEKEKLRVSVETVSRSGWIESEAKSRINMVYPTQDQIIYINVNPSKVAMIAKELEKINIENAHLKSEKNIPAFFSKLVSVIRI